MNPVDWQTLPTHDRAALPVVDSRRRLRWCLAGLVGLLLVVFGRQVQLEVTQGAAFREFAARPLERRHDVPGVRGRILAAGGEVLACDKDVSAVAVDYRYLQQPADARWLRETALRRLSRAERKVPGRRTEEERRVLVERDEAALRLAQLAGVSPETWNARAARIQAQIERIAQTVNRRRHAEWQQRNAGESGHYEPITVREELDYHVVAEDLSGEAVAEIRSHPDRYPGAKIVEIHRRVYPHGPLAAHLLGYLGADEAGDGAPDDPVGKRGVERQYEHLLYGRRGVTVELTDHGGRVLRRNREKEPTTGSDLVLTLDLRLQQAAERLLAEAIQRNSIQHDDGDGSSGGACVVINVHSGAMLAAAAAPTFDPNLFATGGEKLEAVLTDPAHPLFDRVCQMAIPPGSVFKIVSAAALLKEGGVTADEPFTCQGFLHSPERWRCEVYRRLGHGHGDVTLEDALAVSCNVYFFRHAASLGAEPILDWGRRFGFGEPTGVDLPGEAAGNLSTPPSTARPESDTRPAGDALAVSIGQGTLEATPLQVVRMMAAVANGGWLVTPHVTRHVETPPTPVAGLDADTLASIREGLRRVVADPRGTAYATVRLDSIAVAGKTGTAQTGGIGGDHAWFAGYVPVDHPRMAFVVVLEHAGDASDSAAPLAKRLVLAMQSLGYFD